MGYEDSSSFPLPRILFFYELLRLLSVPPMKRIKTENSAFETSGSSTFDLPVDIFYDIMLSLTTWSIVMCKNVCKRWHELLSDSAFAKQHLAQAKPCILVRDRQQSRFGRALYMVDSFGKGDFDHGNGWCEWKNSDVTFGHCRRSTKVKHKLKIPLRNPNTLISRSGGNANSLFGTKGKCKRRNYMKLALGTLRDHIYSNISSCNGLLVLYSRYKNCITCVGNPITGEFIDLPPPERKRRNRMSFFTTCMGFSTNSNRYKVLQVYHVEAEAEIFTLGGSKWTCVNLSKFQPESRDSYIFFNGALHWICYQSHEIESPSPRIACFDLDEEDFRPLSLPLPPSLNNSYSSTAIGVLGDRLCLYHTVDRNRRDSMDIWAMEEYGVAESWTKLFSVDATRTSWKIPLFKPLSLTTDGVLLVLDNHNTLIKFDQFGELRCIRLKCNGIRPEFAAISHIPSFVSLKDIVDPAKVKIKEVYKSCGRINLIEENYGVYLACGKA